jgi:hypothetical protein
VMEEKASIQELMTVVNEMMWNTKIAMRSYMMLRPRFTQPGGGATNGGSSNPSVGTTSSQPVTIAPAIDLSALPFLCSKLSTGLSIILQSDANGPMS